MGPRRNFIYPDAPKACLHCGNLFERHIGIATQKLWDSRKFCSRACGHEARRVAIPSVSVRLDRGSIPEPNTGCTIWLGAANNRGYGLMGVQGKLHLVHRLAYREHYGEFDPSLDVLHKCDMPPCCNPMHLFLGTAVDNGQDMATKFRSSGKMTKAQVLEIRLSNKTQRELAKDFGVSTDTISKICLKKIYRHVR